jgi:glycosyltransferase involved in cell wall biosynthesis
VPLAHINQRIRVLRVIARLNIGGPAIHATLLTERLDPTRYDSQLISGKEDPQEGNYLTLSDRSLSKLSVIPELRREIQGWSDLKALFRLIVLMREFRPHIVHTHTAKAGTLGRLAARLVRIPIVVHTYHGHVLHSYFSPIKTKLFLSIERRLARWTDRLLTVSEQVRSDLLTSGVGRPECFTVMPLGLDLDPLLTCENLRGQLRTEIGIPAEAPLVGIVARLVPIKRHEWFLEAAAQVVQEFPTCQFLLVGDGERHQELRALVGQFHLDGQVHFLGWRYDLARIYADLDVAALTSANEGLPVSLIEAMAAGRPVVSTRVGGVPDLVEDGKTGLLVPPDEPTALAEAICTLLSDPQRGQMMGQAGRARVHPSFSAARLLDDMDQLYTELVAQRRGNRS